MFENQSRTDSWVESVNSFPEDVRADIDHLWETGGVLSHDVVGKILTNLKVDIGTFMMLMLPIAKEFAVVPVSHYHVGAVSAGMEVIGSGWRNLYLGANFEFANAALSFSVHAEQAAVNNAWLHGEEGIQLLAISAAPCGYCRQFLNELVTADKLTVLLSNSSDNPYAYTPTPFTSLLPDAFGPKDLGVDGGLMNPALGNHKLALTKGMPRDSVVATALQAASSSYAPYLTDQSNEYAGIAIQLLDGTVFTGRYAENAAYNPSLSPLESALAFMNMNLPLNASRSVIRCVLVEVPTLASQLSATKAVLDSYAPAASFEYYTAKTLD